MKQGILLLHGFSGGPYEIEPLTAHIRQHMECDIVTPTYCGHGEELSMRGYKAQHWLMDAELAYRQLAKRVDEVTVIGFSMGGVIALYLAKRYPVKKLVLLSAAIKYMSPGQMLMDLREMAGEAVRGHLKNHELFQRYERKLMSVPLSSVVEFMRIVKKVEPYIEHIAVPTYIIQGEKDGIVPHMAARFLYDTIQAKEKHLFLSANGKHHICFSDDCEEWFCEVLEFLCTS
ncbi:MULTISPECIES: alpha/beta fold hydrolase [Bacillales]|uniref:Alpha/beta fold hydrolase n=1 Tax=Lysinibacillus louembei TaxID=1470088 RepID=A0ABZ0RZ81_9BACI|nr:MULTISPECIES: alpha/beta fold hydrolase [Bacillales]MCT6925510.1 alpha/beta fold hydrolase [Metasolibacillus sp.]MCT6941688.1 alpha/beta fold hydrolase [Metasolibacillus sp.]WPK13543.1 alpha/beta fold hydrolase [Lysinibacillus louembei]